MTKNAEVRLEDLYACRHLPEIPLTDADGVVRGWICRCGRRISAWSKKGAPTPAPIVPVTDEKR